MGEKHLVIDGIRFNYTGLFSVAEFFRELDDWTDENGFERENKKKLQHVTADSKRMEYFFELWKGVADYAKVTVKLKALFKNVVDIDVERRGHKRNMQQGDVLVFIDGFIETDIEARWQTKPWFVFVRTIWEKTVWKYWLGRYDNQCGAACYSLYNRLFGYFKRYKY